MCRSPQGPLFFGKKPQLFPLSPYLHFCIIPYYRAFGQSVFSKSGSKRAKKPPKAKEKPLPSQPLSLGKIHSFPPGLSEKNPRNPAVPGIFKRFGKLWLLPSFFVQCSSFWKQRFCFGRFRRQNCARAPVLPQKLRPIWTANSVRRDTGFQFIPACS